MTWSPATGFVCNGSSTITVGDARSMPCAGHVDAECTITVPILAGKVCGACAHFTLTGAFSDPNSGTCGGMVPNLLPDAALALKGCPVMIVHANAPCDGRWGCKWVAPIE